MIVCSRRRRHFGTQCVYDVLRLLLSVPLLSGSGRISDSRLLERREQEVGRDERVGEIRHHGIVLSVHDLLVGEIEEAKPVLAESNLKK